MHLCMISSLYLFHAKWKRFHQEACFIIPQVKPISFRSWNSHSLQATCTDFQKRGFLHLEDLPLLLVIAQLQKSSLPTPVCCILHPHLHPEPGASLPWSLPEYFNFSSSLAYQVTADNVGPKCYIIKHRSHLLDTSPACTACFAIACSRGEEFSGNDSLGSMKLYTLSQAGASWHLASQGEVAA